MLGFLQLLLEFPIRFQLRCSRTKGHSWGLRQQPIVLGTGDMHPGASPSAARLLVRPHGADDRVVGLSALAPNDRPHRPHTITTLQGWRETHGEEAE